MKNLATKFKSIYTAVAATTILSVSLISMSYFNQQNIVKQFSLSNGVGTCFQRVSQSFTSLMIGDYASEYVQKPFMNTTAECFNYASTEFQSVYAASFASGGKVLKALTSDLHWFHEKTTKLLRMAKDSGINLGTSNIINKYSSLEDLKDSFQQKVDTRVNSQTTNASYLMAAGVVSFAASILLLGLNFYRRRNQDSLFAKIEAESERNLDKNSEFVSANVERALENILLKNKMPHTYNLFNKYHSDLLERAYNSFEGDEGIEIDGFDSVPELEPHMIKTEEPKSAYYQEAMSNVLDSISSKAFSHGIYLDTELEDDFHVKGESEILEQVLYNVFEYSASKCLNKLDGRRISVKSKALGGTAYLKVKIENYFFNANELDYIGGNKDIEAEVDLNLVLISEVVKDLNASINLKNKIAVDGESNGCEIELIFERVEVSKPEVEKPTKTVTSVMKGSKKDILRSLSANS